MSTNCINCIINQRTGLDLLCDDCRIRNPSCLKDIIDIDLSPESRKALKIPRRIWRYELEELIENLKRKPDADFPKGKWATIQHLQSQLYGQ